MHDVIAGHMTCARMQKGPPVFYIGVVAKANICKELLENNPEVLHM